MLTEDSYTGRKVSLKKCEVSIIEGDIFYVLYKNERLLELSDFQEVRALHDEWSAEKRFKLLIEFPFYTSATYEARKYDRISL